MKGQSSGVYARQWLAEAWLSDGSLESVQEINSQCLELLVAMAASTPTGRSCASGSRQMPIWSEVPGVVRDQLASSPYLLVDAGFADETRWRGLHEHSVHDLAPAHAESAFWGPGSDIFIRRVLVFGWHMARANPQLARVMLGLTPGCAGRLAAVRLRDLDWLAENRPGWVRLRWESQPAIWRHLVLAAKAHDPERLTMASLRGIQMLAAGALGRDEGR
jgi:hypothetical protein